MTTAVSAATAAVDRAERRWARRRNNIVRRYFAWVSLRHPWLWRVRLDLAVILNLVLAVANFGIGLFFVGPMGIDAAGAAGLVMLFMAIPTVAAAAFWSYTVTKLVRLRTVARHGGEPGIITSFAVCGSFALWLAIGAALPAILSIRDPATGRAFGGYNSIEVTRPEALRAGWRDPYALPPEPQLIPPAAPVDPAAPADAIATPDYAAPAEAAEYATPQYAAPEYAYDTAVSFSCANQDRRYPRTEAYQVKMDQQICTRGRRAPLWASLLSTGRTSVVFGRSFLSELRAFADEKDARYRDVIRDADLVFEPELMNRFKLSGDFERALVTIYGNEMQLEEDRNMRYDPGQSYEERSAVIGSRIFDRLSQSPQFSALLQEFTRQVDRELALRNASVAPARDPASPYVYYPPSYAVENYLYNFRNWDSGLTPATAYETPAYDPAIAPAPEIPVAPAAPLASVDPFQDINTNPERHAEYRKSIWFRSQFMTDVGSPSIANGALTDDVSNLQEFRTFLTRIDAEDELETMQLKSGLLSDLSLAAGLAAFAFAVAGLFGVFITSLNRAGLGTTLGALVVALLFALLGTGAGGLAFLAAQAFLLDIAVPSYTYGPFMMIGGAILFGLGIPFLLTLRDLFGGVQRKRSKLFAIAAIWALVGSSPFLILLLALLPQTLLLNTAQIALVMITFVYVVAALMAKFIYSLLARIMSYPRPG